MKFRHKIEQINPNGVKEFRVNYYHCDEVLIGRGSNCQIRLDTRLAAAIHARISLVEEKLLIEDLSEGRGTFVNKKEIKQEILKDGDKLKIAEVEFKVFYDGTYWGLHEVRREVPKEDNTKLIEKQLKNLDLNRFYPRYWSLIMLFVVAIFVFAFIEQYQGDNLAFWSSGQISNSHKILEGDCRSCHEKPYQVVQDKVCLRCHELSEHSSNIAAVVNKHPEINFKCVNCHFEHQGDNALIVKDQRLCLQCHSKLDSYHPETKNPRVKDFNNHPEFVVNIPQYQDKENFDLIKIALNDKEKLKDTARIKFTHKKHLVADLKSPNGPKTLVCNDCHKLKEGLREIKAINYSENCATCHTLGFDERLPEKVVPHGEADIVFNFLYAEYAKLFLDTEKKESRKSFVKRFRPGQTEQAESPSIDYTKAFVEEEARKAEEQLFTKTACYLCHEVERTNSELTFGKSNYLVLKPNIPVRWMPSSIFSHGAHQYLPCLDCHQGAKNSEQTSDVLLPKIKDCKSCHATEHMETKVQSDCTMCHSYHESLDLK